MIREIRVMRDGTEFGRRPLELLHLPDGSTGANWGGLVFPLKSDDCIDLSDPAVPPGQCKLWAAPESHWQFTPGAEGADSYLFVDGSAQDCNNVVGRLRHAGFVVVRSGPNLSGGAGDWFVRVSASADLTSERIGTVLGAPGGKTGEADGTNLRERLLTQALVTAHAARDHFRRELEQARLMVTSGPVESSDDDPLRKALEAMSRRLAEVETEAEALRARIDAAPRPLVKPGRLEVDLGEAAATLLPRLDFVGDSMRFIAVELPNRSLLWRALLALDRQERGQPQGWKSVSGHNGWWERHFSTGRDNQGRLYARSQGQPARWQVLVSHKQDQPMDLRRLARL